MGLLPGIGLGAAREDTTDMPNSEQAQPTEAAA